MSNMKLEYLIHEVADSPTLVAYLEKYFADSQLPDLLLRAAEESPYPIRQWLEALDLFEHWLNTRKLSLPVKNQIAYVACSSEGGSAYATLIHLPAQVEDMLENYGCDEAIPNPPTTPSPPSSA